MAKRKDNPGNPVVVRLEGLAIEVRDHNKRLDGMDTRLSSVQTDLTWLKRQSDKLDTRTWEILAGVVISIVVAVGLKFWGG